MGNLIRSHLARLWKQPVFWLAMLAMIPYGVGLCNSAVGEFSYGNTSGSHLWGQPLFGFGLLIGIVLAAVFSLFFGAEYADGTIRSKIIAGHRRVSIYLAALISSLIAALALYLVCLLSWLPRLGWMLQNFPALEPGTLALCMAGTLLALAWQCSLCVMLCMLIQKRAVLAVALILLMVGLLFASFQAQDAYETATRGGMQMMIDETGEQQFVFHEPGQAGPLVTFFYDALPGCQAHRYMGLEPAPAMLCYSTALFALTTTLGLALFRRKDIR